MHTRAAVEIPIELAAQQVVATAKRPRARMQGGSRWWLLRRRWALRSSRSPRSRRRRRLKWHQSSRRPHRLSGQRQRLQQRCQQHSCLVGASDAAMDAAASATVAAEVAPTAALAVPQGKQRIPAKQSNLCERLVTQCVQALVPQTGSGTVQSWPASGPTHRCPTFVWSSSPSFRRLCLTRPSRPAGPTRRPRCPEPGQRAQSLPPETNYMYAGAGSAVEVAGLMTEDDAVVTRGSLARASQTLARSVAVKFEIRFCTRGCFGFWGLGT